LAIVQGPLRCEQRKQRSQHYRDHPGRNEYRVSNCLGAEIFVASERFHGGELHIKAAELLVQRA